MATKQKPVRVQPVRLLTREEAALFLGLSTKTLAKWASEGRELRFVKVGRRAMYRQSELDRYVDARTVQSAGEAETLN